MSKLIPNWDMTHYTVKGRTLGDLRENAGRIAEEFLGEEAGSKNGAVLKVRLDSIEAEETIEGACGTLSVSLWEAHVTAWVDREGH